MKRNLQVGLYLGVLVVGVICFTGCGGDSSDNTAASAPVASTTTDTNSVPTSSTSDVLPHFPDGLHPDDTGSASIAAAFNDRISSTPSGIGSNSPNVIVCLGDSITAVGYPAHLASMTGKTCINDGLPGEETSGGAARVAGVLDANHPAYLCIMYGSNDIICHRSLDSAIANLSAIIATARGRNTIPILATIPPMSGDHYGVYADQVTQLNNMIRALAGSSGTVLADVEREF